MPERHIALDRLLIEYPYEVARRRRVERRPTVAFLPAEGKGRRVPGGSICVVTGRPDSALVQEARRAAENGDAALADEALAHFERHFERLVAKTNEQPAGERAQGFEHVDVITDVEYKGRPIAQALPTSRLLTEARVLATFAGGDLDPEAFIAAHHVRSGDPEVETVVLVRPPVLSDLERRVLDKLPREVDQISIGRDGELMNWLVVAAIGAVAAAGVAAGAYFYDRAQDAVREHNREIERQVAHDAGVDLADQQAAAQDNQADNAVDDRAGDQAEAAQDDGGDAQDKDDDGGSLFNRFDQQRFERLERELATLTPEAAVSRLVDLRTRLVMQDRLR